MPNWAPNTSAFLKSLDAAWPMNELEVGLDEQGALAEVEAIGQLDDRLVILDAAGGTRQLSISLRAFQVFAEVTGCDA